MMEIKKFKALIQDKKENQLDEAYYVNFFSNDTAYFYSEKVIRKYATQDRIYCNKTTAIDTGKRNKDVLMIPTDKAIIFRCGEDGKWHRHYNQKLAA